MSADFVLRVFVSDFKNLPSTGETCHHKALGNDWLDITCINDLCLTFKIKHIIITFFCVFLSQFCSLFFGSVLPPSSQMATQPVTSQEVLASDSEDDSQVEWRWTDEWEERCGLTWQCVCVHYFYTHATCSAGKEMDTLDPYFPSLPACTSVVQWLLFFTWAEICKDSGQFRKLWSLLVFSNFLLDYNVNGGLENMG